MNNSENLKTRVDKLARNKGYASISVLAQATGLNYANLTRVLNGKQNGDRTIMKLANFFNVSYDWLATGCGSCGAEVGTARDESAQGINKVYGSGNTTVNNVNNGNHQTNSIGLYGEGETLLHDKIRLLEDKIRMLESGLADKERIIKLMSKNDKV